MAYFLDGKERTRHANGLQLFNNVKPCFTFMPIGKPHLGLLKCLYVKYGWTEFKSPKPPGYGASEGLLANTAWFQAHGFSRQLLNHYVNAGWLEQPARGVYKRPRGQLTWELVVISLQTLLQLPVVVGGRTALELQNQSHYLTFDLREVHLYGTAALPHW